MLPVLLGMLVSLQHQSTSLGVPLSVTVYNDIPAHYEVSLARSRVESCRHPILVAAAECLSRGSVLQCTGHDDKCICTGPQVLAGAVATARSHLGARPRVVWAKQVRKATVNESTGQPLQYPPPFGLVDWVDGSTGDGATGGGESKGGSNWTLVQLMPPTVS